MQDGESRLIVVRFFDAVRRLKADGVIRGKQTFTTRYGINRWNFCTQEKQPERDIFQVSWLARLAEDYKVSPSWLLLGKGEFYRPGWDAERVRELQKKRKAKEKDGKL